MIWCFYVSGWEWLWDGKWLCDGISFDSGVYKLHLIHDYQDRTVEDGCVLSLFIFTVQTWPAAGRHDDKKCQVAV